MAMIYSLVSRGHETVLSSYTSHTGNFDVVSMDVLKKTNLSKTFGQFGMSKYNFYTFCKQGFIFLVMVESDYETRIAVAFLKQIQEVFFNKYQSGRRHSAVSHSLSDFNSVLREKIQIFNDKAKVDKFFSLKKQLTELQENSLKTMEKIIQRGQKIDIIVNKTQTMTNQSYDLHTTARTVRRRMWWKNKKIMVGLILLVALLIFLLVGTICGFKFDQC